MMTSDFTNANGVLLLLLCSILLHFGIASSRSLTKDGRANPDFGTPLSNSSLKVRTHAHTQLDHQTTQLQMRTIVDPSAFLLLSTLLTENKFGMLSAKGRHLKQGGFFEEFLGVVFAKRERCQRCVLRQLVLSFNSFAESPWPTTIFLSVVTMRSGLYLWAHDCRDKLLLYRYITSELLDHCVNTEVSQISEETIDDRSAQSVTYC
ncbi:hypothetical protein KCU81_g533, partial [Aureobasidium melanogenum]